MNRMLCAVFSLSAGCGNSGPDDSPTADAAVPAFAYQSFTALTRSLGHAADRFQLSVTDTIGPIACGLAQDHHNGLGTSGHQIIANVAYIGGYPCPVGTHSMRADCSSDFDEFYPYVPEGCAYYRRYDAQGRSLGMLAATAGAVSITGDEAACTFEFSLSFSGTPYFDAFTLTDGLVADPWCMQ